MTNLDRIHMNAEIGSLLKDNAAQAETIAALRAEVEQLKGAIGQARFCIRELVPAGKDRELTLSVIDAAINARKESE